AGRFQRKDGREQSPSAQAGLHRRSESGRPVQRRMEDEGPDQGAAVEPVHRRQRRQEGRAGEEIASLSVLSSRGEAEGPAVRRTNSKAGHSLSLGMTNVASRY